MSTDTLIQSDADKVVNWRFQRLIDLGFDHEEALLLAEGHAELSLAERLLAQGCAPHLAFCILA